MRDIEFGNRLYQLRRKAGLSQARLGEKVGVSNKAVSKWENGQAKPGLDIVHKLADVLSVSVDEFLNMPAAEKQISKIVITGGPCAGKTSAMTILTEQLMQYGVKVIEVREQATALKQSGKTLKVERKLKIEKSLISVEDYANYRKLLAAWQSHTGALLRTK